MCGIKKNENRATAIKRTLSYLIYRNYGMKHRRTNTTIQRAILSGPVHLSKAILRGVRRRNRLLCTPPDYFTFIKYFTIQERVRGFNVCTAFVPACAMFFMCACRGLSLLLHWGFPRCLFYPFNPHARCVQQRRFLC